VFLKNKHREIRKQMVCILINFKKYDVIYDWLYHVDKLRNFSGWLGP